MYVMAASAHVLPQLTAVTLDHGPWPAQNPGPSREGLHAWLLLAAQGHAPTVAA